MGRYRPHDRCLLDGKGIVFGSRHDGTWQLYMMQADGSAQTLLPQAGGGNAPALSPGGRKLSFTAVGHDPWLFSLTQPLGISSVVLQSALLKGVVCLLVRRWRLAFGALSLIITLNSLRIVVLRGQYILLPAFQRLIE